ncbi:MAG: hypothetical protein PSX71_10200 [bacterium]|nr:hypothetical protein [bacterium]
MRNDQQTPEQLALRRQIRRDVIIDTLGNTALALGLWGWLGEPGYWNQLLKEPALFICLTASGILNLVHMPKRLIRLRQWQKLKNK